MKSFAFVSTCLDPVALVDDAKVLEDLLAQGGAGGRGRLGVEGRLGAGLKVCGGCLVHLELGFAISR